MSEIIEIIGSIYEGLKATAEDCSLSPVYPDGVAKTEIPVKEEAGRFIIEYTGEGKGAKVEYYNNKIALFGAKKEGEIISSDYSQLTLSLLDPENANEKDVKYIVNDFSDTLVETFGTKTQKPVKSKLPTPVSKAAAKSGAVSYDPNTLANRFTTIYPELRAEYKANIEKYGQFLPEEFFTKHGNAVMLETIKKNNPTEMRKLFKLLNDIYENGTNETQSLICVTMLGSLENNQVLLANCVDYMSDDLASPVINVNKFLYSSSGKGSRMRLENPPTYKPKKKKKSNITSSLGM